MNILQHGIKNIVNNQSRVSPQKLKKGQKVILSNLRFISPAAGGPINKASVVVAVDARLEVAYRGHCWARFGGHSRKLGRLMGSVRFALSLKVVIISDFCLAAKHPPMPTLVMRHAMLLSDHYCKLLVLFVRSPLTASFAWRSWIVFFFFFLT